MKLCLVSRPNRPHSSAHNRIVRRPAVEGRTRNARLSPRPPLPSPHWNALRSWSSFKLEPRLFATTQGFQRRPFSTTSETPTQTPGSTSASDSPEDTVYVNWIQKDGTVIKTPAKVGQHLLEIAHKNGIDLEGACEGSLACSTCHVIVKNEDVYKQIEEDIPPTDEENDMLDLAFGLTETSRLGCQIKMSKKLDGLEVILPQATRNMAVDGYKPKPH